jgi:hypothetical protein
MEHYGAVMEHYGALWSTNGALMEQLWSTGAALNLLCRTAVDVMLLLL